MRRMAEVTQVRAVADVIGYGEDSAETPAPGSPAGIEVFEILGSFCFGATQKFTEVLGEIRTPPRVVVLRMRHVLAIDATGLRALEETHARLRRAGTAVLLSGVQDTVRATMDRSGLLAKIGPENVVSTFEEAMEIAVRVPSIHTY